MKHLFSRDTLLLVMVIGFILGKSGLAALAGVAFVWGSALWLAYKCVRVFI